ncbi:MAG: hypothetical protein ACFBSE_20805 [Prochloraceae cyanobacterium]
MPRKADEYAVHFFLSSAHTQEVRFKNIQEFQQWYSSQLMPKSDSSELINIPIENIQGEWLVIRPASIMAIRVEPIFLGSVERF